jgi:inner membrane protein
MGNVFRAFSGGHRHMTHSIIGILLVGWALRWSAYNLVNSDYTTQALALVYAFMIGYISHPIADTFTDRGVPWFWPLHFHIKLPPGPEEVRVTTDSFVERIIVRSGIVITAVILIQSYLPSLANLFKP